MPSLSRGGFAAQPLTKAEFAAERKAPFRPIGGSYRSAGCCEQHHDAVEIDEPSCSGSLHY